MLRFIPLLLSCGLGLDTLDEAEDDTAPASVETDEEQTDTDDEPEHGDLELTIERSTRDRTLVRTLSTSVFPRAVMSN